MTWKDLAEHIAQMTDEQKGSNVTAFDTIGDEFYPVEGLEFTIEDDILDKDHPFFTF